MEYLQIPLLSLLSFILIIAIIIYTHNSESDFNTSQYPAHYMKPITTIDSQNYYKLNSTKERRANNSVFATLEKKLAGNHKKIIEHLNEQEQNKA